MIQQEQGVTAARRRINWFAYALPPTVLRRGMGPGTVAELDDSIDMTRDGGAGVVLLGALARENLIGDVFLNFPPRLYECRAAETPALEPQDVLLVATRPPLSDDANEDGRPMWTSNTSLEAAILDGLETIFRCCTRTRIWLSEAVAQHILAKHPERRDRIHIQFDNHQRANYTELGEDETRTAKVPASLEKHTAGYLVYIPRLEYPGNPSLLAAFGMNGPCTQAWTQLLSQETALLESFMASATSRVLMGEFSPQFAGDTLPATVAIAVAGWPLTIVFDVTL